MATSSQIVDVSSFSTDAKFRAWGLAVSTVIQAAGLTLGTDTGQINWVTVTRPTTANTKAGYEIYRFNDTAQTGAPIYFRIDYGTNGNASGQGPTLWFTAGTGTDGAGNVTGIYIGVGQANNNAAASTNANMIVRASYSTTAGTAFFDAGMIQSTNSNTGTYVIQRSCDSSGAITKSAMALTRFTGPTTCTTFPVSFSPVGFFNSRSPAVGVLNAGSTSVSGGGVIELSRFYITAPNPFSSLGSIGYLNADIAANATFSAAPWGATSHTYVALGSNAGAFEQGANANICAAVIWE